MTSQCRQWGDANRHPAHFLRGPRTPPSRSPRSLEADAKAVVGGFEFDGPPPFSHLGAEMSEHHSANIELFPVFEKLLKAEVKVEPAFKQCAFAGK